MLKRLILVAFVAVLAGAPLFAAEATAGKATLSLSGVAWDGSGADLTSLQGKAVVLLTYVTWCPKCNEWAPELLSQLNKAAQDKPVVILAIATDVGPQDGRQFLASKNFVGPNILYGADPNMDAVMGLDKASLWSYAVIDAGGQVVSKGPAGMSYGDKRYVAGVEVSNLKQPGKFQFITPEMSEGLKQILWPLELGQVSAGQQNLKKAEKLASGSDRELLKKAVDSFVQSELENMRKLAAGDVPDKLSAIDKASVLSASFKATDAGQEAKKLLAELVKDKTLKKELGAKKAYEAALGTQDPDRRALKLQVASKNFSGTYYGEQAAKAAAAVVR